ncbi:MAG: toll/interleukin-1 receptor domain-containing protein [Anaerolineaceae bacterium]|nr:toll/interleukin-1 receptor domain-containing protein [Anaerolineaceae bacterium]MDE0329190.1 toll/interleukin-1 receptor domain-containing protein [Anaerolineaceae bacterium]
MSLEEFLAKVCARPMPSDRMAQVRTVARELAEGVLDEQWSTSIWLYRDTARDRLEIHTENLEQYFSKRWRQESEKRAKHDLAPLLDEKRLFDLLVANFFISPPVSETGLIHTIEQNCFDLLEEIERATIFVSYRRSESSSFALLVLNYLKSASLVAFLDLALEPGENWHASLEEKIAFCDYFVLLLGKSTLYSKNVCQEIMWAMERNKIILPIWQPNFVHDSLDWERVPIEVQNMLNVTHAIRIQEESALEYHKALTELLNRFGITP